jgi:hypothetical protein
MQLCDGSNGTVDLRNRFVVCADADSGGVAKSTVTGSAQQTHDGQIPEHTHGIPFWATASGGGSGQQIENGNTGTRQTNAYGTGTKNVAVFFALAFIQRIGG